MSIESMMGFSSFGRPNKKRRKYSNDKIQPSITEFHEDSDDYCVLHHIMPRTTVDPTLFPSNRIRKDHNGVVFLIKSSSAANAVVTWFCSEDLTDPVTQDTHSRAHYSSLLKKLESCKARFRTLDPKAFAYARCRSNPYERIGRYYFLNRSAMKMANLDFLFKWTHTQLTKSKKTPFVFADVCGGPGGFSEYLLSRLQAQNVATGQRQLVSKGFGISLKDTTHCDWQLPEPQSGTAFHVCYGSDGTGNLYSIANIHNFRDTIYHQYPKGVNLVVADGGFPEARNRLNQESMMSRLILAEIVTMFSTIQHSGSFVCKTFELSTPLMLDLVWVLHQSFETLTVVKLVTTRPASSERYIVTNNFQLNEKQRHDLLRHLEARLVRFDPNNIEEEVNRGLNTARNHDTVFTDFMSQLCDCMCQEQIDACDQLIKFALPAEDATIIRSIDPKKYYRAWGL